MNFVALKLIFAAINELLAKAVVVDFNFDVVCFQILCFVCRFLLSRLRMFFFLFMCYLKALF